jgi:hypothetical protein
METNSADDYGLAPTCYLPESDIHHQIDGGDADLQLKVSVIFTDAPATLAALREANAPAKDLTARLQLLMAYEVPYTLPLCKPAVRWNFSSGKSAIWPVSLDWKLWSRPVCAATRGVHCKFFSGHVP